MNKKCLKISVIIPVYNGSALIERCLNSVFNQNGDFDLEVIVIDDGSTDNSVEIVKNHTYETHLITQKNEGAASARNRGVEIASGKYLAYLDADDYWLPNFLKRTSQFLENTEDTIAVNTAQIHKIPGRKDILSPSYIGEKNIDGKPIILDDFFAFWAEHKHVCTGSVLIKTEIVKKTDGQLKELRISQDLEFWSYLGTFGKWGFIPEVLFISDGGKVTQERGWLQKNMIRWKSTPSIEAFSKRTLLRLHQEDKKSFDQVLGWVAYNFTYGHIMAKNYSKAYNNISKYGKSFPPSKGSLLVKTSYRFGKSGFVTLMFLLRTIQISRHYLFTWRA